MRFLSDNDRHQHSQARLIPDEVWSELFYLNDISEQILHWMALPCEELKAQITPPEEQEKPGAWVAIAFSHPEIDSPALIDAGKGIGLSPTNMLDIAYLFKEDEKQKGLLELLSQQEPYSECLNTHYTKRLQNAARFGCMDSLHHIIEFININAPNRLQTLIAADNFCAFQRAADKGRHRIVRYLLHYPSVFAYADEKECPDWQQYLSPLITETLKELKAKQQQMVEAAPQTVFDVSPDDAQLLYYMARNIIRGCTNSLFSDLYFLVSLPQVNALLAKEVTRVSPNVNFRRPNDLLYLAMRYKFLLAAKMLLNFPEVLTYIQRYYSQICGVNLYEQIEKRQEGITTVFNVALNENDQAICLALLKNHSEVMANAPEEIVRLLAYEFKPKQMETVNRFLKNLLKKEDDHFRPIMKWYHAFFDEFSKNPGVTNIHLALAARILSLLEKEDVQTLNLQNLAQLIIHVYFTLPKDDIQYNVILAMLADKIKLLLNAIKDENDIESHDYRVLATLLIKYHLGENYDVALVHKKNICLAHCSLIIALSSFLPDQKEEVFDALNKFFVVTRFDNQVSNKQVPNADDFKSDAKIQKGQASDLSKNPETLFAKRRKEANQNTVDVPIIDMRIVAVNQEEVDAIETPHI